MDNIKFAIFDLDGTLLNTLDDLAAAVNFALAQNGMPKRDTDEVRTFIGHGIRNLIKRAVTEDCPEALYERTFRCFKEYYAENSANATRPYAGVREALLELKKRGFGLAVVSNKADALSKTLIECFYPDVFDTVWGEREGVAKKPSPEPLLLCCRELGAAPENVLYIGDTEVDLETARAAGCRCGIVTWGFRSKDAVAAMQPELVVDRPADILAALK